jgi:hypothetical protein
MYSFLKKVRGKKSQHKRFEKKTEQAFGSFKGIVQECTLFLSSMFDGMFFESHILLRLNRTNKETKDRFLIDSGRQGVTKRCRLS